MHLYQLKYMVLYPNIRYSIPNIYVVLLASKCQHRKLLIRMPNIPARDFTFVDFIIFYSDFMCGRENKKVKIPLEMICFARYAGNAYMENGTSDTKKSIKFLTMLIKQESVIHL